MFLRIRLPLLRTRLPIQFSISRMAQTNTAKNTAKDKTAKDDAEDVEDVEAADDEEAEEAEEAGAARARSESEPGSGPKRKWIQLRTKPYADGAPISHPVGVWTIKWRVDRNEYKHLPVYVRYTWQGQQNPWTIVRHIQGNRRDFLVDLRYLLGGETEIYGNFIKEIGRAVQQECRDRSRMPSSA
eukprot:TRINITY_DN5173_c0_g1_i2.p2 TRINITY_DN5173_c0_g1~~TRINITY_DN5173_c0_g1_i2.p2  ORF type:complete len:185 (+),score=21.03 TRINITY_DN5173_c0_g1_i2:33-587(+)